MKNHYLHFTVGLLLLAASPLPVCAQGVIWNGPAITFTNLAGSDWTQPANADQLTPNVWLTRSGVAQSTKGLFNYFEGGFVKYTSPTGTEWALGSLANYSTLTYTDWTTCYGGRGNLASTIVSTNAVLHLIAEDIYLSIRFTSWGSSGGGFTYTRSTPSNVPEPTTAALALTGLFALVAWRRK